MKYIKDHKYDKQGRILPMTYYNDQKNYDSIGNNVERLVLSVLKEIETKPKLKGLSILQKTIECLQYNLDSKEEIGSKNNNNDTNN